MKKILQGKESIFDSGIMCARPPPPAKGSGTINRKSACEGAKRHLRILQNGQSHQIKCNVLEYPSSINSNSVTLQKKMDHKRKL